MQILGGGGPLTASVSIEFFAAVSGMNWNLCHGSRRFSVSFPALRSSLNV